MIRGLLLILGLVSSTIVHGYDNPSQLPGRPPTNCSPRLSNRLRLGQFFSNSQSPPVATQERILSNLVQNVYGSQPIFYRDAKDPRNRSGLINLFARIRKEAINLSTNYRMTKVEDLANVDLGDRSLQFTYFILLTGGTGNFAGLCSLPPLLPYISLKKSSTCVDAYLAQKPILLAIFGNENVVGDLMQYRQSISTQLRDGKTTDMNALEKDFRDRFERKMLSGIDPRVVSFRVSDQYLPKIE